MDKITHNPPPPNVNTLERTNSETSPSPVKASAGSREWANATCYVVDTAIENELGDAKYLSDDLPRRMFGHLVSTELARDILAHFLTLERGVVVKGNGTPLAPGSEEADCALDEALQDATEHGLRSSECQQSTTRRGETTSTVYSWEWTGFPSPPIQEDDLVVFLNSVIRRAFDFSQSRLIAPNNCLRHRFAAPLDKTHALPLSYEADGKDLRPDFLLLPVEGFLPNSGKVDQQYVNLTAVRAVGESKTTDLSNGVVQVERYLRRMRGAQPWIHFGIGMVVTKAKVCLMRGDSSGMERVHLTISEGRGCLELIRILLGLALADPVDLGQNPDVELDSEVRSCRLPQPARRAPTSREITTSQTTTSQLGNSSRNSTNGTRSLLKPSPVISATHSTSPAGVATSQQSKRSKRRLAEVDDARDPEEQPAQKKTIEEVRRRVFFPLKLHGHKCLGNLYNASSIRGRCTAVSSVHELSSKDRLMALKMSWQDAVRLVDQEKVLEQLSQSCGHPNMIASHKHFKAFRKGKECSTLQGIRGFLEDQLRGFGVENRFLFVSISHLKRPVKYFWGLHDFVRGLRGALLGHQYLVSIGILHRDISENNVVLALFPWDERGYLIDLDMAILQEVDEPTSPPPKPPSNLPGFSRLRDWQPDQVETPVEQGLRTGTMPYMSYNVLRGGKHTYFDDVESFFYVLLLFFFSYSAPLAKAALQHAHDCGFIEPVGSGPLTHRMRWPARYARWAEGDLGLIANHKFAALLLPDAAQTLVDSYELKECLKRWSPQLTNAIRTLLCSAIDMFSLSTRGPGKTPARTQVSHDDFIELLEQWLVRYGDLEDEFSNCPDSIRHKQVA